MCLIPERPDSDSSSPPENWRRQSPYRTCPECGERVNIGKTPVDCIDHLPVEDLPKMFDDRCQRALRRVIDELKAARKALECLKNLTPHYALLEAEEE